MKTLPNVKEVVNLSNNVVNEKTIDQEELKSQQTQILSGSAQIWAACPFLVVSIRKTRVLRIDIDIIRHPSHF